MAKKTEQPKKPAFPVMTPEQRAAALAKAAEVRTARSALLAQVKNKEILPSEVLRREDDLVTKIKVSTFIRSVPGYGTAKCKALMDEIGIFENRRLGGLGKNQRDALIEILG